MRYSNITSLHSPRIEEVGALLGSRGKKLRKENKKFVVEGAQSIKEALRTEFAFADGPKLESVFLTESGLARIESGLENYLSESKDEKLQIFIITDQIAKEIAETENSQGIFGIASFQTWTLHRLLTRGVNRIIYLWEVQDPGNLGTVIRTAAGLNYDAVVLSPNSVDIYSPKVQRSTVGAFFHIPVIPEIEISDALSTLTNDGFTNLGLAGESSTKLSSYLAGATKIEKVALYFGNEARGLPGDLNLTKISLEMNEKIESFNLSVAAAIAMNATATWNGK
jgi:TrmH family RNA methyltransferase